MLSAFTQLPRFVAIGRTHVHFSVQIVGGDGLEQVVEAALAAGATRLFCEDTQHGQKITSLIVENPFLSGS